MRSLIAIFTLFMVFFAGCDPVSTQIQVVKNSAHEDITLFRNSDNPNVLRDTFQILAGEEKQVFYNECKCIFQEESCSHLKYIGVENDSIRMITRSGKLLKKNWFDDNNWTSEYRKRVGAYQTCTIEVFDGDFE